MGCVGCFNDFGGPWDIIDGSLGDVEIDDDHLPFYHQNRLSRRRPPAAQHHSTAERAVFVY